MTQNNKCNILELKISCFLMFLLIIVLCNQSKFCLQIHVNLKLEHSNIQMRLERILLFNVIWVTVAKEDGLKGKLFMKFLFTKFVFLF